MAQNSELGRLKHRVEELENEKENSIKNDVSEGKDELFWNGKRKYTACVQTIDIDGSHGWQPWYRCELLYDAHYHNWKDLGVQPTDTPCAVDIENRIGVCGNYGPLRFEQHYWVGGEEVKKPVDPKSLPPTPQWYIDIVK